MADLFDQTDTVYIDNSFGGKLTFIPEFLSTSDADILFQFLLHQCQWRQEIIHVYGKDHPIPRLQVWLGNGQIPYTYSGKTFISEHWPTAINNLAAKISEIAGVKFNTVLGNLYRNGHDSMGWHADDEVELGKHPVIASLSLGATRDFAFRQQGATRQHSTISLPHGSLLIMHEGIQEAWQHSVPKRKNITSPRINLTFRKVLI